jgi:tRNA modification GTPase
LALAGIPLLLTDTAGLRETQDEVEAIGVARAAALVEAADVLVWLGEPGEIPTRPRTIEVHAKADVRGPPPEGALAVSSVTGQGMQVLLERIGELASSLLPAEDAISLNRRQAAHVEDAALALANAVRSLDVVVVAECLRHARGSFDRLTGKAGVEDVLDALFSRFCLGK